MNEQITWFRSNGKKYYLKEPIELEVSYDTEDNLYWTENSNFDIEGMGTSLIKAVNDARIEIMWKYEWKYEQEIPVFESIAEWIDKVDNIIDWEKSK